ncbi:mandelate racemase/muconate lactonizing enzyme family protein [Vineibacter terrae]|uniref:mandelate racemase/muconate lactonizing enzyme family protein n=1 Tax=Vineibacter terrae TaxID=2586908 RepID=UPI002E328CE3|nr:mandelate racemase/muconate lactonizing enzyme family protein [Vineibacter terrae]HEX2889552.1 mandelate racemase/muconate lactonizing enzyme family protein [Vineibacter terrae]
MKITSVEVLTAMIPRAVPRGYENRRWEELPAVVAIVRTDTGIEGIGHTITLNHEFTRSLATMVGELGESLIGLDPRRTEQCLGKMLYPANWVGPGGMLNIAACAIDIAIWDIVGKDLGQPLWRLLGGATDRVRVYESGMLIGVDIDTIQRGAEAALKAGYRAMKMRPGPDRHGRAADAVARVRAVRDVIGYDVDLMYDVNQTWTPSRAIQVGRALEPFELFWIEDPTLMHDVAGQAAVARALDVPVCAGEYHYDMPPLLKLLEARAVDYPMVDMMRMGGITQFRKVAAMAEAFGVPVASHLIPEVFCHCIAAIPNGLIVEGMPWTQGLFRGLPDLVDGKLVLSERPGHGLELDPDAVRRLRVS